MKKTLQLMSIFALLLVFACKQGTSNAASNGSNNGIVGTWKYDSFDLDTSKLPEEKKASMEMAKSLMGGMFKDAKLTFAADGMCEMGIAGSSDKVKYTSTGDGTYEISEGTEKLTFKLVGDKLNMNIDKDEMHMIVSFTK